MINNSVNRNVTRPYPVLQALVNEHALGKILIKNVYQGWQGESIQQIRDKHESNPYSLRIGKPRTDTELKGDAMYFILHYLSYNPLTKDIEKRELVPLRNTEKIYIGQSLDEKVYSDYRLFVDGNVIADDMYLKKHESIKDTPVGDLLVSLAQKIEKLQLEVINLKRELNNKHIYTQGTLHNE